MPAAKIAISLDEGLLSRLDSFVAQARYRSRSEAVQEAISEQLARSDRGRLARECAKLCPAEEGAMADEGLAEDLAAWPAF